MLSIQQFILELVFIIYLKLVYECFKNVKYVNGALVTLNRVVLKNIPLIELS